MNMESAFFPWKKYTFYSLVFVLALFIYQWVSSPVVVSVSGIGSVSAPAELATVTYGLAVNSSNSESALNDIKALSTKIKQVLSDLGVPESSIYESQVAVLPVESGFQASMQAGFNTKNIPSLDRITLALYSGGASAVSQPVLSVSDNVALEKKAYDMAVKDAKSKAWQMSISNLKFLKKMILIQESAPQSISTVTTKPDVAQQVEDNLSPDTGLIKINKAVSISYKMW